MKTKHLIQMISAIGLTFLSGCAHMLPHDGKVVLDSSAGGGNAPQWVQGPKVSWQEGDRLFFKSSHTIRGDERVSACFDLARMNAKETILTEISEDIKGRMDEANESISESAETILSKSRSSEYQGRLRGLRVAEQYFERSRVSETERVECFVLTEISKDDYSQLRKGLITQIIQADPRIKEAVKTKQLQFFSAAPISQTNMETEVVRKPAAVVTEAISPSEQE